MSKTGLTVRLTLLFAASALLLTCDRIRFSASHFADFELREPKDAATVNGVAESCAATAESAGSIPAGYRRMPRAIANCTEHPPETLLDYSLWDGIDPRATPGYDDTRTCWRLKRRFRDAALRLADLRGLFSDGTNLPAIKEAMIDHMVEAATLYYWNDGDNFGEAPINALTLAHADAMADLAVTGRTAYAAFVQTQPLEEGVGTADQQVTVTAVRTRLNEQNPDHDTDDTEIQRAIDRALDRAYTTLWAIRGPIEARRRLRSGLGYIAVAADEDPPHRPLNVFSPNFSPAPVADGLPDLPDLDVHQQNVLVAVPIERRDWSLPEDDPDRGVARDTFLGVDIRYLVIVDAEDGLRTVRDPDATFDDRTLPPRDYVDLPEDHDVVLMIHGHSSRAEEAMDLARPLIHEWSTQGHRNLAVIALDLPSNGYSQMLDHRLIADVESDGSTRVSEFNWHDGSFTAYYPTLDFIEETIVRFVEQLTRTTYFDLDRQIKVVVGGSLGGNMGLRLSQRDSELSTGRLYLRNIVAWSPASTWGDSWARARICSPFLFDCFTLTEDGTYSDTAKHESVRVTRDKYRQYDEPISAPDRRQEVGNRKLEYFVNVFTTSSSLFEAILEDTFPPQGERWYRDGWSCRTTYLKSAIFDRWEIYNKWYRLWHWRVAHEQLIFMHEEPYVARGSLRSGPIGGERSYELFTAHVLLAAGSEDNEPPDRLYDNTRHLAVVAEEHHDGAPFPKLTGYTLWMEDTGHSIHNERPNFLAKEIWDFRDLRARE